MIEDFPQYFRSGKKISGHSHQVLAHNFEAVLAEVVKFAGEAIFEKIARRPKDTF